MPAEKERLQRQGWTDEPNNGRERKERGMKGNRCNQGERCCGGGREDDGRWIWGGLETCDSLSSRKAAAQVCSGHCLVQLVIRVHCGCNLPIGSSLITADLQQPVRDYIPTTTFSICCCSGGDRWRRTPPLA